MDKVEKSPKEITDWLRKEYNEGNYKRIDYGVWFHLDESVMPKKYFPKVND